MRLLAVLLGVGLALGLTVFVMDRVNQQEQHSLRGLPALPGGLTTAPTDGAQGMAPGAPAAAATVTCETNRATISAAEDAYDALHGRYADLPTLVAAGVLRPLPAPYRIVVAPDGASFRLDCTGAAGGG